MTNDEINRFIHTEIMGECSGVRLAAYGVSLSGTVACEHSKHGNFPLKNPHSIPDYCSDSSPRELLNAVVVKVTADIERDIRPEGFGVALQGIFEQDAVQHHSVMQAIACGAMATAEQIARAVVAAWKAGTESQDEALF